MPLPQAIPRDSDILALHRHRDPSRGDRPMAQKKPTVYEFIPKLGQLRDDVLFGDVWEHPDLGKRDRSLITVAMLAALYRTDEMRGHMQSALDNGVTETEMKPKNTICLWFDKDAHEAARFYAATFPNRKVTAVYKAPSDYPSGKEGDVLMVEFTVLGIPCLGLNGGPDVRHSEAFSFQIATDNQEETDRYWNAIVGNGGKESQCGWCKDRWGLSWQITPRVLIEALAAGGAEAKRAFEAMMPMQKIDVATIEAARRG